MIDLYSYANHRGKHRDLDILARWRHAYSIAYKDAQWPLAAKRLSNCGKHLEVDHYEIPGLPSFQYIRNSHSCLSRLCPICARSVALKSVFKLSKTITTLDWHAQGYIPLFLTLTIPAVSVTKLKPAIDNLLLAWKRFRELKQIRKAFLGTFRGLETNINQHKQTANPHIHCLLFAHPNYFDSNAGLYLRQKEIVRLWRHATTISNTKVVDIRRITQNPDHHDGTNPLMGAVLETAKYCVKMTSIIEDPYGPAPTVNPMLLDHLHDALHGRRLHSYTGVLGKAAKLMNEEEEEKSGFLPEEASRIKTEIWKWHPHIGKHTKTRTNHHNKEN